MTNYKNRFQSGVLMPWRPNPCWPAISFDLETRAKRAPTCALLIGSLPVCAPLSTHWVMVVIDQFTSRIIWFGVHHGGAVPDVPASGWNGPLYRFHQWQANLRVLGVTEIKRLFLTFDLRTEAYKLYGVDVTQIPGLETSALSLFSEVGRDFSK